MREAYYNQPDAFAAWSPTMFKGVNSIELQGYWQYLPAIQHLLPIIEFDLFDSLSSLRTELGIQYGSHDCVGFVHIRRGDYVDKSHIHHLQQEDYYQVGMKSVEAHRYVKRWRVFSDDLEWCKQQPWLQGPRFEFIDEPDELRSLMLMSMCPAGAVIANSTFSWWGAMLGPSKTGIVVYPSKWLLEAKPILFPSHWIKYGP
jgi:hypothetical protein